MVPWFKKLGVTTLVALIMISLFGCGGQSRTNEIRIVYAGPMTGGSGAYGEDQWEGMQMAVEEINKTGIESGPMKGAKLKLEGPYDDRCDPVEAANIAQRISGDPGVWAYFGHVLSSCTLAALPILASANKVMINSYSSNPKITQSGYKNIFRILLDDNSQAADIARIMAERFHLKRVAIAWANDDYGRGLADAFRPAAKSLGLDIAVDFSFTTGDTDFSVLVTKMKAEKVDGLALLTLYNDGALILRQAKSAGVDVGKSVTVVGTTSNASNDFMKIGGDATENCYLAAIWDPRLRSPEVLDFNEKYSAKHKGKLPSEAVALGYDAVMVFKKAIEMGANDPGKLADYLRQIKGYRGITGEITFNENGQVINKQSMLLVVKNGEFVPAEP